MTAIRIAPLRWAEYTAWREENEEEGDPAQLRARRAADSAATDAGDHLAARPQRAVLVRLRAQSRSAAVCLTRAGCGEDHPAAGDPA